MRPIMRGVAPRQSNPEAHTASTHGLATRILSWDSCCQGVGASWIPGWDSCGQGGGFLLLGACISPHRGNALHPMGGFFIQDSFTKPFKNHTIRLSAGCSTSAHRQFNFTLGVGFSYRIPGRRNPDSCVFSAGFLFLGHRIPGLGFQWPRNSRGRVGWAWLAKAVGPRKPIWLCLG